MAVKPPVALEANASQEESASLDQRMGIDSDSAANTRSLGRGLHGDFLQVLRGRDLPILPVVREGGDPVIEIIDERGVIREKQPLLVGPFMAFRQDFRPENLRSLGTTNRLPGDGLDQDVGIVHMNQRVMNGDGGDGGSGLLGQRERRRNELRGHERPNGVVNGDPFHVQWKRPDPPENAFLASFASGDDIEAFRAVYLSFQVFPGVFEILLRHHDDDSFDRFGLEKSIHAPVKDRPPTQGKELLGQRPTHAQTAPRPHDDRIQVSFFAHCRPRFKSPYPRRES